MSGYEAEIEEMMSRYRQKLADISGLQRKVAEVTGTAATARQSVRATVNAQGDISVLEFPTGAYKRMPPAELAGEIMAAVGAARAKAQEALRELISPELPDGARLLDLVQGRVDAAAQFPAEPPMPDAAEDYLAGGADGK